MHIFGLFSNVLCKYDQLCGFKNNVSIKNEKFSNWDKYLDWCDQGSVNFSPNLIVKRDNLDGNLFMVGCTKCHFCFFAKHYSLIYWRSCYKMNGFCQLSRYLENKSGKTFTINHIYSDNVIASYA